MTSVAPTTAESLQKVDIATTLLLWCNPATIAVFATWFGATGIFLWCLLPLPILWTLPLAIVGGLAGAQVTLNFIGWLATRMYASGTFSIQDAIGLEAEVTVPLSAQGLGEIIYVHGGVRYTAPARMSSPEALLSRGARAIICDIRDDIAYVEPWEGE